jgi:uncharacterized membrane protein YfcA
VWKSLAVGLAGGLLSGFFGVGGGIVMVPLLVGVLHFGQHEAHASSLAAIFLIAVAAFAGYLSAGEVDLVVGVSLGLGGVVGSILGAQLMHRLSPNTLRGVFAVAMIVAGVRMVV